jgi:hypothetical protein
MSENTAIRAHQLDADGRIINTVMVMELADDQVDASIGGGIGDSVIEGVLVPGARQPVLAEAVPMLNLKLQLIEDGKLATVEAILDGIAGDDGLKARAYWQNALTARRDNYLVNMLWPALYATEVEFNTAWALAAALQP